MKKTVRSCLAAALLGLSATLPARAAELVVAVGQTPLSLPLQVAQVQGYFAAEGVAVRTLECFAGARCLGMVFERSAQLATVSEVPVVVNSFERSDFAIVATIVSSNRHIKLLGRKSAGAVAPAQLEGKRIGVIVGSSSQYFLDAYLLFHGIDPKRVRFVPLLSEQLAPALIKGEIDAFAGYGGQTVPAMQALGAEAVVLPDSRIYTERLNLVADRATLVQRPDDVVKLLRALERAQRYIAEQPQQARQLLHGWLKSSAASSEAVFNTLDFRLSLDQSLVSTMEGEARWAQREGHVPADRKIPNYLQFVEFGPLRAAVPSAFPR